MQKLWEKMQKKTAVCSRRSADKTNDCPPFSLRRCVTHAGFMVEDQMFDRKLRKLAYGFLRVSLLRSDSAVCEVVIFFYYKNNTPPERRCRS